MTWRPPPSRRVSSRSSLTRGSQITLAEVGQEDADAVFAAGWDEKALHDAIAVTARMNFMCRLVQGYGFTPMSSEKARANAESRKKLGYRNLYPKFAGKE